jgi:predicted ribonuclease YlaK
MDIQKNRKIYVLDTSVLIEDPDVFYKLGDSEIIVPTAVIKEIDGLKKNADPEEHRAKAARKVARTLDRLGSYQDISTGAKTPVGSIIRISNQFTPIDDLASNMDNRVVGTAIRLREESGAKVILISTDGNMRSVARAYKIKAENYPFMMNDDPFSSSGTLPLGKDDFSRDYSYKPNSAGRSIHKNSRLHMLLSRRGAKRAALALIVFIIYLIIGFSK